MKIFEGVTKDESRSTLNKCLEKFSVLKQQQEKGQLRSLLEALLTPLCKVCECDTTNVVDSLSFVTGEFYRVVFNFLATKVRKNPDAGTSKRIKDCEDHEDHAKTYYICGCVRYRGQRFAVRQRDNTRVWWSKSTPSRR